MFEIANVVESMGGSIQRASCNGRKMTLLVSFERSKRVASAKPIRVSKDDRDLVAQLKKSGEWAKLVAEVRAKIGTETVAAK